MTSKEHLHLKAMLLGEGATDFGTVRQNAWSEDHFGPMANLVANVVADILQDNGKENEYYREPSCWMQLIKKDNQKATMKHHWSNRLEREYVDIANKANLLVHHAQKKGCQLSFFFKDADRKNPRKIRDAMAMGFEGATAVSVIPVTTSEAWIISAYSKMNRKGSISDERLVKTLSGNDKSPNSAKNILNNILNLNNNKRLCSHLNGEEISEVMSEIIAKKTYRKINLPSFNEFKQELKEKLKEVTLRNN